jgi:hypothetical protein
MKINIVPAIIGPTSSSKEHNIPFEFSSEISFDTRILTL